MTSAVRTPTLVTLVYGEVLLMRRVKDPYAGFWTAPGGNLEPGESPRECAARELREETGFEALDLRLRGIVAETAPQEGWRWLMFVYVVRAFTGTLTPDEREGEFTWWPLDAWERIPMPEPDRWFFEPTVLGSGEPFEATIRLDADLCIARVESHPAPLIPIADESVRRRRRRA
jgi:ADP-ribose pyrophosphatase YjhB (NUDIX family)